MINFIDLIICKLFNKYFKKKNVEVKIVATNEEITLPEFEKKIKQDKEEEEFEKYINQNW